MTCKPNIIGVMHPSMVCTNKHSRHVTIGTTRHSKYAQVNHACAAGANPTCVSRRLTQAMYWHCGPPCPLTGAHGCQALDMLCFEPNQVCNEALLTCPASSVSMARSHANSPSCTCPKRNPLPYDLAQPGIFSLFQKVKKAMHVC